MGKGVAQIYDGLIPDLRSRGYALEEIGEECNVSRECIRQILNKFYPDSLYPSSELLSTRQIVSQLKISTGRFRRIAKELNIQPVFESKSSRRRRLWDNSIIPKLLPLIGHTCRICGNTILPPRFTYCSEKCYLRGQSLRCYLYIRKWQHAHKDKVKEYNRKAYNKRRDQKGYI